MQSLKNTARNTADDLSEVFTEMRAHLYLYAGHLLMKITQYKEQWRAVLDLAALCYLVAYQVPHNYITIFSGNDAFRTPSVFRNNCTAVFEFYKCDQTKDSFTCQTSSL